MNGDGVNEIVADWSEEDDESLKKMSLEKKDWKRIVKEFKAVGKKVNVVWLKNRMKILENNPYLDR